MGCLHMNENTHQHQGAFNLVKLKHTEQDTSLSKERVMLKSAEKETAILSWRRGQRTISGRRWHSDSDLKSWIRFQWSDLRGKVFYSE